MKANVGDNNQQSLQPGFSNANGQDVFHRKLQVVAPVAGISLLSSGPPYLSALWELSTLHVIIEPTFLWKSDHQTSQNPHGVLMLLHEYVIHM